MVSNRFDDVHCRYDVPMTRRRRGGDRRHGVVEQLSNWFDTPMGLVLRDRFVGVIINGIEPVRYDTIDPAPGFGPTD